jgi:hypothetical protein
VLAPVRISSMALLLSCTPARQDSSSTETFDETLDCRATSDTYQTSLAYLPSPSSYHRR